MIRWVVPLVVVLSGCNPACESVCKKALDCGNLDSERVALDECEASCLSQGQLYRDWEDEELQDRFRDHKICIRRSTCEEIADGECYDDLLFQYKSDDDLDGIY